MTPFADAPHRLFAVAPGESFADRFAAGLWARIGRDPPDAMARVTVILNTARGLRAVEEALAHHAGSTAFLPKLVLIGDIGALVRDALPLPSVVDPLRRRLHLIRLVAGYLSAAPGRAPLSAAPDLAESLAQLLDELQENGTEPGMLDRIAADQGLSAASAAHWRETLRFLDIIRRAWPEILAEDEGGAVDPGTARRRASEAVVAAWQTRPPAGPVIAAGSTGSRGPTATVLAAVAGLPQGAVVLPGFDAAMDPDVWQTAGPEHPYAPFRPLLDQLGLQPGDARAWAPSPAKPSPRLILLSQALRPAPVTDAWIAAAPMLAAAAAEATAGLALVEADGQRQEAAAIALAIRHALEEPAKRIALVTPDAALARRATAELARFGVVPDDSLGRPLAQSPPAVFLRLIAGLAAGRTEPVQVAALLQHPLARAGFGRGAHLRMARAYERAALRGPAASSIEPGTLPPWPGAWEDEAAWLARVARPLVELAAAQTQDLPAAVRAHRAAAEALSADPDAGPMVWSGEDGRALRGLFDSLAAAATAHGPKAIKNYAQLFTALFAGATEPPEPARPHPRVMIWGTQEARVQSCDLTILAGLNEGVWPALPDPGPWLSRPMREAIGLPPVERQTGLSAHDFLQGAARAEVILTRAKKVEGTPTVPSRWLTRLTGLLTGTDPTALETMRDRGRVLLDLVPLIHRPNAAASVAPAPRPRPCPPVAARPRSLSVTQIELLIRDAYAIYARKILGLVPLDPLGRSPDARDRGEVIHTVLQRFVAETPVLPEDAEDRFTAIAEAVLAHHVPAADLRRIWLGRLRRTATWLVSTERARREIADPLALEVKGALELDHAALVAPFTLTARADRIDRLHAGGAAIIDYKSGTVPSKEQVGVFSHQLHLQGLILAGGGFDGAPPLLPRSGAYLGLSGGREGGKELPVDDIDGALAEHKVRLLDLLASYDRADTPYVARGRPFKQSFAGDYDHLSRRAEWEEGEP
ncbi:MAG: PD-(D/E)XK nuclease family protein [Pseudomonadota bacterium]